MLRRLRALFRHEQIHDEIADEHRFHVEMLVDELIHSGMSENAARLEAQRRFGSQLRMQEIGFDQRGAGIFDDMYADARIALRLFRKAPARSIAIVAVVALGIGINTAVFSVMKSIILEPLPFPNAQRLIAIHQVSKGETEGVSYPNYADWRAAARSFDGMAVYASDSATFTVSDHAERLAGAVVSANLFQLLGVAPLRGRLFEPADDEPSSTKTVLIGEAFWQSHFHRRSDAVGATLALDGVLYRIIGVIPATQQFPVQNKPLSYWISTAGDAQPSVWGGSIRNSRGYPRYDAAIARLREHTTLEQAQAEMNVVASNVAQSHPKIDLKEGVRLSAAVEDVVGKTRPFLWTLYGAVFCVLAVACANAATLLLVGSIARAREFAIRAALGARSTRLLRQLLIESSVVAIAGGIVGAFLALALVRLFVRIAPPDTPRLATLQADPAMLFYAVALSIATGLLFGFLPAKYALRNNLVDVIKEASPIQRPSRTLKPGTLLITAQIALSMALGCSAAVFTSSFWRILHTPRGFDKTNVLTAAIALAPQNYPPRSQKIEAYYTRLLDRIRNTPGVELASAAQSLPLSGQNNSTIVEITGSTERNAAANLRFIAPDYFKTLRIPLLAGRYLDATDQTGRPPVVVVNQAFQRRFLASRDPIGQQLKLGWGGEASKQIVGVVGDIRHYALEDRALPEMYVPIAQFPLNDLSLVIRAANTNQAAQSIQDAVRSIDPSVPLQNIRTLDEYLLLSSAPQSFLMWILIAFAASTLLLSVIGLYGALSYATLQRRHEFGIRMALGSSTWRIRSLVLREGMRIALTGIVAGLALTFFASRFLERWLYETKSTDTASLAIAILILIPVALLASWIPARRATRAAPLSQLRAR